MKPRYFADYLNCTTSREKHFDDCAASYHPVLWIFTFGPAARTAEEEHGQPRCRFCRFNYVSVSALAAMLRSFCAQSASISEISHGSTHELFLISKTKGNLAGMRRTHSPNSKERKHNLKASEDVAFIREKTYTLPITLARGLRMRARTKRGKKRRRKGKPGGVLFREKTYTLPITLEEG